MTRLPLDRLPLALLALPALARARLLPAEGVGAGLRVAAAMAALLVPGALLARALARFGASATLAWSLALVGGALGIVFALDASIRLAAILLAIVAALALPLALRVPRPRWGVGWLGALAAGVAFGIALWQLAGDVSGDQLFHLARTRKLLELDSLDLSSVNEFADGDLHPGYAFPLWHAFLALVAHLSGIDPAIVFLRGPMALAPLAVVVAYEAGLAVFRSAWLAGAVAATQVSLIALAPPHGGAYPVLTGPGTAARQLLVPAVVALFFASVRRWSWPALASLVAATAVLAAIHITYAVFVFVPLAGFVAVRALIRWRELRRLAATLAAVAVPTLAVSLALLPLADDTASRTPEAEERARALVHYATQLEVFSQTSYRLRPDVFSRTGAIAIAALLLVPAAALAARRRWGAFVLGGSVSVLLLMLVPDLFTRLSDASSLSQSRRAAGFFPFAFALVGGAAALAGLLRLAVLPLALAAGWWLRSEYAGSFGTQLGAGGGPELIAWIAVVAGAAALVFAVVVRPGGVARANWTAAAAVALFLLPTIVRGFGDWTPSPERQTSALTRGLVAALRERVPAGAVVFSDLETSYRITAAAPVYVAAAPPAHVADTNRNRPYRRREDVLRFYSRGELAIPRRYGARWLVVDRTRKRPRLELKPVYRDRRYALYRLTRS